MGGIFKQVVIGGVLLTPTLAFADVAPKCGCAVDSAGVGLGWVLLAGITALVIRHRRRG